MKKLLFKILKIVAVAALIGGAGFATLASADVTNSFWAKQANGQLYTNSGNGLGNAIINVAGCNGCGGGGSGPFSGITGNPWEVAYFDAAGNGTGDAGFIRDLSTGWTYYQGTGVLDGSSLTQFQGDDNTFVFGVEVPFEGNLSVTTKGDFESSSLNAHIDVSAFDAQPPGTYWAEQSALMFQDTNTGDTASVFTLRLPAVFGDTLASGYNLQVASGLEGDSRLMSDGTQIEWSTRIRDSGSVDNELLFSDTSPLEWKWGGDTIWKMPTTQGAPGDVLVLQPDGETLAYEAPASVSPAGSDTWIQFNEMGAFGARSDLKYDYNTREFNVGTSGTFFYVDLANDIIQASTPGGSFRAGGLFGAGQGTELGVYDSIRVFSNNGYLPQPYDDININRSGVSGLDDISISVNSYNGIVSNNVTVTIDSNNSRWLSYINSTGGDVTVGDTIQDNASGETATVIFVDPTTNNRLGQKYLATDAGSGAFTGTEFTVIAGVNVGATGEYQIKYEDTDTALFFESAPALSTPYYPLATSYGISTSFSSQSIGWGTLTGHTIGDVWIVQYVVAVTSGVYADYLGGDFQFGFISGSPGHNNPKGIDIKLESGGTNSFIRMGTISGGGTVLGIGTESGLNDELVVYDSTDNSQWFRISPFDQDIEFGDISGSSNGFTAFLSDASTIFRTGDTRAQLSFEGGSTRYFAIAGQSTGPNTQYDLAAFDIGARTIELGDVGNVFSGPNMIIDIPNNDITWFANGQNYSVTDIPVTVKVTVTSAELLAIGTTPKVIVPAPGAGKFIQPLSMMYFYEDIGASYSGTAPTGLTWDSNSAAFPFVVPAFLFTTTTDNYGYATPTSGFYNTTFENQALIFTTDDNSDPVGGDGEITLYVTYKIVSF